MDARASPTAFEQPIGYSLPPYLPLVGQAGREDRLQLRLRHARPRAPRHQPRADQPLQREPPEAAEGVGERARPEAARPALRPADRRDAGERAAGHPRGRVARLQEPRRLPPPGRRARPGRQHDPLQRGGRDRQRRLQHDVGAELRKLAPEFAAGVNQNIFHGFCYATSPEARWPGFSAFSPRQQRAGYGESWGPRQPTWKHASDVSRLLRPQPAGDADRPQHRRRGRARADRLRRRGLRRAVLHARHARGRARCSRTAARRSAG